MDGIRRAERSVAEMATDYQSTCGGTFNSAENTKRRTRMKRSILVGMTLCAGLGLTSVLSVSSVFAQPSTKDLKKEAEKLIQPVKDAKEVKPAAPAAAPPDQAAMQEAWMKLMELNEHHERFKMMEGTWDAALKHWMDPAAPPMESKGTMTNTLIHGGRYVQHDFKGDFMGDTFTGSGTYGYNNATHKYEGTWTDNMGTGTMFMVGTYDEKTKTYTSTGEMNMGPSIGIIKMRDVVQIIDNDHHLQTMYHTMPGVPQEMKVMEISYSRAGAKKAEPTTGIDAAKDKLKEAADKIKKDIGK